MKIPSELLFSLNKCEGFSSSEFEEAHLEEAPTSIRLNINKQSSEFQNEFPVAWCKNGFYLSKRPNFTLDPLFHSGCYYVQEASSMFLAYVVEHIQKFKKIRTALDACAAPGGKSTLLLDTLDEDCFLVCNEIVSNRNAILVENLNKWGRTNVMVTQNATASFVTHPESFDLLVVDAPCSGSGMLRKDPESIREWSLNAVDMCSKRQQNILSDLIPTINQDGFLIYSTCSLSIQENEKICDSIIENFNLKSVKIPLEKEWNIVESQSDMHKAFGYRFYQNKIKGEGFFLAVFSNSEGKPSHHKHNKKLKQYNILPITMFEPFLINDADLNVVTRNGFNCAVKKFHVDLIEKFSVNLYVKKVGVELGSLHHSDFSPSHALALSSLVSEEVQRIEVDYETAIKYLRREPFSISTKVQGWMLVCYKGYAIGWIKKLANRVNNYFPKQLRILH